MEQQVEPLAGELAEHAERQRSWVKGHFAENADEKYAPLEGKLRLLETIIKQRWIEPTETWKLQSLGITFGDALSQKLGMAWVRVEDEHGESPALRYPGTTLLIFPLTAISKRIERGEGIDVYELFDGFCRMAEEQKAAYRLN